MSFAGWVYLICGTIAVVGCIALICTSFNARRIRARKGAKPGQGGTVVSATTIDMGHGSGQVNFVVPRDPQAYAKSMMPRKK